MKKLISIKHYPSNFEVAYEEKNETSIASINYDGLKGELTRKEWQKDPFVGDFLECDQETILDTMETYEIFADEEEELSLAEIAELENLQYVETTSGTNGYPQDIQDAIIGFENWEQLEEIAEKYKLEAINLHKRDGWQLYERQGSASEPFENSGNDYGDDYFEFDDAEGYQKSEMEDVLPYAELSTFEDIENWVKKRKEVYEELLNCGENEIVITYQGRFYDKIREMSMSFSHDTHNYIIGLQRAE